MRILAITNQKGGVGKTTTCVNLAASLAATKRRVLLIDLDPQGNATTGSGVEKSGLKHTIYHVLIGDKSIAEVRVTADSGFDVVPANRELAGAEVELVNELARETRLKVALSELGADYDYILIDCPPALNLVTVNALTAAHAVMIPMQCEYYALEGLSDLVNTIKKVRAYLNPGLEIEGLLRTLFDPRNMLAQQVSAQLTQHFGDKVYRTVIPRNVRLAEAPSYGQPALAYDRASKGAQAYLALAGEIINRSSTATVGAANG
ncbi:MAG: ParA family protein [Methylophilaceae bacterium]|jgi:chromosome partitioning protein|uniref:ParA family protein n=1 Tax=Methylobacillus sp. MM3 TaxID=1848039 RepID=UPI0007DEA93B|nr:ParA family protein [Methylobacillus sp. MM3]OAJ70524.1 chromosome partitioning protein [Methylobacillus sp. MM3]